MPIKIAGLKVYSIAEISKILNITPLTLRRYMREGRIRGTKVAGKWYVTEEKLQSIFTDTKTRK